MATGVPQDIPPLILEGLEQYRDHRIPTGGFLTAVLENDLLGAVSRADDHSRAALWAIVGWVYNNLPAVAWGSRERVSRWLSGWNPTDNEYNPNGGKDR